MIRCLLTAHVQIYENSKGEVEKFIVWNPLFSSMIQETWINLLFLVHRCLGSKTVSFTSYVCIQTCGSSPQMNSSATNMMLKGHSYLPLQCVFTAFYTQLISFSSNVLIFFWNWCFILSLNYKTFHLLKKNLTYSCWNKNCYSHMFTYTHKSPFLYELPKLREAHIWRANKTQYLEICGLWSWQTTENGQRVGETNILRQ